MGQAHGWGGREPGSDPAGARAEKMQSWDQPATQWDDSPCSLFCLPQHNDPQPEREFIVDQESSVDSNFSHLLGLFLFVLQICVEDVGKKYKNTKILMNLYYLLTCTKL
jgi:hypothetical protein